MSGEYEHHQALLNERRLTKSKSVPIEHSQQLIYNGNSKYNSEELGTMSDEVFMSETINGWDPNKCNGNLSIDSDHLVVLHKETSVSCCSVFAKSTIENHNFGFFYYEVTIVKECGPLFIGLANKRTMSVDGWVGYAPGSYAYSSGRPPFWPYCESKIRPIDTTIPSLPMTVIGCGVNLMTKQIIYTKNGVLLDTEKLYVNSIDLLYPCVTSLKPGNKIEANFGPNFEFNSILAMVESSSAINNENLQVTSGSATNDENLQVTTI
uniref:B30.2/SPRY domain-containing protein n=1 Tax=Globodera pallida TaxID=36090 RepID=A0A183CPS7_GLOPA